MGAGPQANVVNYFGAASAQHPTRNDVLRWIRISPRMTGYFRYINGHDDMIALFQGVQFSSDVDGTLAPPGHAYSGTVTYSVTPMLINEFTIGKR